MVHSKSTVIEWSNVFGNVVSTLMLAAILGVWGGIKSLREDITELTLALNLSEYRLSQIEAVMLTRGNRLTAVEEAVSRLLIKQDLPK